MLSWFVDAPLLASILACDGGSCTLLADLCFSLCSLLTGISFMRFVLRFVLFCSAECSVLHHA
jgi:hypothetical protein